MDSSQMEENGGGEHADKDFLNEILDDSNDLWNLKNEESQNLNDEIELNNLIHQSQLQEASFHSEFHEGEFSNDEDSDDGLNIHGRDNDSACSVCESSDGLGQRQVTTFSNKDRVAMIHQRGFINKVLQRVKDKQYAVDKYREELNRCRKRIGDLNGEESAITMEISSETSKGNMASAFRLQAQQNRVIKEREGEKDLEQQIYQNLVAADYELTLANIEYGKHVLTEKELKEKEQLYADFKKEVAAIRKMKEQNFAAKTDEFFRRKEYELAEWRRQIEVHEYTTKQKIRDAHEKHSYHLNETIQAIRKAKQDEENAYREDFERKVKSVLKLKEDIRGNRENLTSLSNKTRADREKANMEMRDLAKSTVYEGGNVDLVLLRQKKILENEVDRQVWKAEQNKKKADIAARLLIEEEWERKKHDRLPYLFHQTKKQKEKKLVKAHSKPKLGIIKDFESLLSQHEKQQLQSNGRHSAVEEKRTARADDSDDEAGVATQRSKSNIEYTGKNLTADNLAQPEFQGMWNTFKAYNIPDNEKIDHIKNGNATLMEQDIMRRVLEQTRANIVTKQIAAGREFKGQAFFSKPEVIHFKDFEVGKTYKKKITLTNASYSINSCKLTGMTDYLKNFIDLVFDPPGTLSAGMACELFVTFGPKINEDLFGEVMFLSQTGEFAIPIQCTTKKCDFSIDKEVLDFGVSVIGESLRQQFKVINHGAKGSQFTLVKTDPNKIRENTMYSTTINSPDLLEVTDKKSPETVAAVEETAAVPDVVPTEAVDSPAKSMALPEEILIEHAGEGVQQSASSSGDADGMSLTEVTSGFIEPFGEVKLDLKWTPVVPGENAAEFHLSFDDSDSRPFTIVAIGKATDLPVWLDRQSVDLRICMYDRLYQDTVIVNNRASTALKLHFEVHPALRNHMELLPKTGYIQANSQFSAQLKFLPRASLAQDAGSLFDKDTGVLEAPMTIKVANQTRVVTFTVSAVVTNSDLEFDVSNIDFGYSSIYESVVKTIKLTNHSMLSQKFGFMNLPDYVEVQPNHGFGVILPKETLELEVVFSPPKASEYEFTLLCRSLINRDFKISCKGIGVHPPLELSQQIVTFKATALQDFNDASVYVVNSHTSMNEYSHPVPRIGKGPIVPVGPTSFEFMVPQEAPFTVSPAVGTVLPGEKQKIHVRLKPNFTKDEIRKEASSLIQSRFDMEFKIQEEKNRLEKARLEELERLQSSPTGPKPKSPVKKDDKAKGKGKQVVTRRGDKSKVSHVSDAQENAPKVAPAPANIVENSDEYFSGQASLLRNFTGSFKSFVVPCFVASGHCPIEPGSLKYEKENTLFLEVLCPVVSPKLAVISNNGRSSLDFGNVSLGQTTVTSVTIQNISDEYLDLSSSLLDPNGPFMMRNALRILEPGQSHAVLLTFAPSKECHFHEPLYIFGGNQKLGITLIGKGITPKLDCSVDGVLDMGAVIVNEYVEKQFKLINRSELAVTFSIKLDSTSLLRHKDAQHLPVFVKTDHSPAGPGLVGVQNKGAQSVFDCVPMAGRIEKGEVATITATFSPDHASENFSDCAHVCIFGTEEVYKFQIVGQGSHHITYVSGGDPVTCEVESLAVTYSGYDEETKSVAGSLLLTFGAVYKPDGTTTPATRKFYIGCVRTMAVSQKKNGEYNFENTGLINSLGFSIESPKGQIEAGTRKPVLISWTPSSNQDPNIPLETSILLTIRGDIAETYRVLLRAFVTSDSSVVVSDGDDLASKSPTLTVSDTSATA